MNIKRGTIIRTLVLLFAIINQLLTATGRNPLPFSEEEVYQALTAVITAVTSIVAWWKNNSFSEEAIKADEYKDHLKEEKKHEQY